MKYANEDDFARHFLKKKCYKIQIKFKKLF